MMYSYMDIGPYVSFSIVLTNEIDKERSHLCYVYALPGFDGIPWSITIP